VHSVRWLLEIEADSPDNPLVPLGRGNLVRAFVGGLAVACSLVLSACAIVDQFESRIYDSNLKSQNAMNQETLVNIVRASRFQTMNFVALTQLTGGQAETLTTGLPTVTFGPAQTIAQHQFQVTNSLSSGATGGFQSNPLVSTTFQSAMLSPISPRTLAMLASSHPREPVLYSVVEAIALSDGDFVVRFENDPTRQTDDAACKRLHGYTKKDLETFEAQCNYPAFLQLLQILISAGFTSELIPIEGVSQKDAPQAVGHLCFDRSRAISGYDATPVCGKPKRVAGKTTKSKPDTKKADKGQATPSPAPSGQLTNPQAIDTSAARLTIHGVGTFDVSFSFRSPVSVFRFYGVMYGQLNGGDYRYYSRPLANLLAPDEPFVNIVLNGGSAGCYTSIDYEGQNFCVPASSANTALIFTILQELRNLSIQSTDLNSAFTVRLSN
jgi:hypothetical protein